MPTTEQEIREAADRWINSNSGGPWAAFVAGARWALQRADNTEANDDSIADQDFKRMIEDL